MAVTIIEISITITISAETYMKNWVIHDYSSRTICSAEAAAGAELGSVMVQTLVWKCVNPNPEFAVWPRCKPLWVACFRCFRSSRMWQRHLKSCETRSFMQALWIMLQGSALVPQAVLKRQSCRLSFSFQHIWQWWEVIDVMSWYEL